MCLPLLVRGSCEDTRPLREEHHQALPRLTHQPPELQGQSRAGAYESGRVRWHPLQAFPQVVPDQLPRVRGQAGAPQCRDHPLARLLAM
ncbi:hypothetical protein ACIQVN_31570 [Streptomyces cyaneofuscatus]|uniref:hypothetical protein n=1 Tax=Streptomyces cyaneofuscatus TaxID=66883 RepID=UPI00382F4718